MRLGLEKHHFLPYSDNIYLNLMYSHKKINQLWEEKQASMQQQAKQKEIVLDKKQMKQIEKKIAEEILKNLIK